MNKKILFMFTTRTLQLQTLMGENLGTLEEKMDEFFSRDGFFPSNTSLSCCTSDFLVNGDPIGELLPAEGDFVWCERSVFSSLKFCLTWFDGVPAGELEFLLLFGEGVAGIMKSLSTCRAGICMLGALLFGVFCISFFSAKNYCFGG